MVNLPRFDEISGKTRIQSTENPRESQHPSRAERARGRCHDFV
jgi:hypothetical protein